MSANLADNLKNLRKEKNVSQETLAAYLNVSFQAVSKWENGNTCPDISLLPKIARFYGITVDELLQVEKLDEEQLYQEYLEQGNMLFHNGRLQEALELARKLYDKIPNNIEAKESLMSAYYDTDKIYYCDEIIQLGTEIYNSDADMYYKGQAIRQIANTYAENGNYEMAEKWVKKSVKIFHSRDILYTEIDRGQAVVEDISFCTYWFLKELFSMAWHISWDGEIEREDNYRKEALEKVAAIYEIVYSDGDMPYDLWSNLCSLYMRIAKYEAQNGNGDAVQKNLFRALECVKKTWYITEHRLVSPMVDTWYVPAVPNNEPLRQEFKEELAGDVFDSFRNADWLEEISRQLENESSL